jgi:hypothetical protein
MTAASVYQDLEQRKTRDVARDYRKAGYTVFIRPEGRQLPDFLFGLQPDLIAISENESVVVEVTTQDGLAGSKELSELTARVNGRPGWRLELVVTNPRDKRDLRADDVWGAPTITHLLGEVRQLARAEKRTAAFLMLWASTEAILRHLALDQRIPIHRMSPAQLVKQLVAHGAISRTDFDLLIQAASRRDALIHGLGNAEIDSKWLDRLIVVSERLLVEVEP